MVDDVVEFANQVLPEQGTGKGEEPRAARWMALGLAGCLALSLSGCGSSGGSDDDDD